ncbi:hypothetical protein HCQ94_02100 [Actinomyces sp. zg-332]|uniref:hypothetical protein n=1 Tax=Actinomyces sp. zg-332 TaxID=2708340 RepID=UPI00141EA20C|nr:hypothetical protein [Actinomyces sp. zg-332]QPK94517.1 hypothetical protein HCQ94_02100 [Actinomyces sp. zg-332]
MNKKILFPVLYFIFVVILLLLSIFLRSQGLGIVTIIACPIIGIISIAYSIISKEYKTIIWGILILAIPFILMGLGEIIGNLRGI